MEKIASLPGINDTELKAVQQCRLYLKAMTISNLTNSAGTAIADWVTDPNLIENKSQLSLFLYPNQGRLTSTTWNIFVTKLQVAYTVGTNNLLTRPLGQWDVDQMHQAWHQVYCDATDTVYSFTKEPTPSVRIYNCQTQWTKWFRYTQMHDSISFPLQQQCLTPISGHFEQGFFIADSNEASNYTAPPPKVDKHKTMERRMFWSHHIHNDIAQAIWTGKAIIGTDGSVLNNNATYGVSILIQQENKEQPKIAISVRGKLPHLVKFTDMDSHQPEAAALFAALVLVCRLLTENLIDPESQPAKSVRYFLDNKSVIDDLEW
jgi:hypothetical protein